MKENLRQIAISLITQYGDEAQTIAMLRAAEYAAILNSVEWAKWEEIAPVSYTHLTLPTKA